MTSTPITDEQRQQQNQQSSNNNKGFDTKSEDSTVVASLASNSLIQNVPQMYFQPQSDIADDSYKCIDPEQMQNLKELKKERQSCLTLLAKWISVGSLFFGSFWFAIPAIILAYNSNHWSLHLLAIFLGLCSVGTAVGIIFFSITCTRSKCESGQNPICCLFCCLKY